MFHFERKHEPLAARHVVFFRVLRNFTVSSLMIFAVAAFGTWGFVYFEGQTFVESLHSAVRIICGLDPVKSATDDWGKWFEIGFYLLSNLVVVIATGLFLLPILHRVLHHFHVNEGRSQDG